VRSAYLAAIVGTACIAACGKSREPALPARDTVRAPVAIAPAVPNSFAWFAGQSLLELRDSVTLAEWLAGHRNDTLPSGDGEWCAEAVETVALPIGYTATRRALFYQPIFPDAAPLPEEHPDIGRGCLLGMIIVQMLADTSEDSLLVSAQLEVRRLFAGGDDTRVFGAERPSENSFEDDHPGDSLMVFGKLPRADDARIIANDIGQFPRLARNDTTFVAPFLDMNSGCDKDLDSLIDVGERLLPSMHDKSIAMATHYMIADAFADKLMENPDTAYRTGAIVHYRAALALEDGRLMSPHAGRSRWVLWRLLAGLNPGGFVYGRDCGD
jgi:hypothetical protein